MSAQEKTIIIELLNQVQHGAKDIYVRETVNGKVGNYALTELPAYLAIQHTCRLIRERLIQEWYKAEG